MSLTNLLRTFKDEKEVIVDTSGDTLKFVEKDKYGVSLKGVLQRGRIKLTRDKSPRPQGLTFRPSTFTYNYCKRLKIGQLAGKIQVYDDVPKPKLQFTFDVGNAIHEIIQGYFWRIGILKGTFHCAKCDKNYHDLISPTTCPSGTDSHRRSHLQYREVTATNPDYRISGRCDGIVIVDGEEHIFDIKSIANRTIKSNTRQFCFEDLDEQGPKEEHIIQLTLYMWMLGIERGHLLYAAKNDHQIKTFAIPYNKATIDPYLQDIEHIIETSNKMAAGEKVKLPEPCGREVCPCDSILSKM